MNYVVKPQSPCEACSHRDDKEQAVFSHQLRHKIPTGTPVSPELIFPPSQTPLTLTVFSKLAAVGPTMCVTERRTWPQPIDFWLFKDLNEGKKSGLLPSSFIRAALRGGSTILCTHPRGCLPTPGLARSYVLVAFFQSFNKYILRRCWCQEEPWQRN